MTTALVVHGHFYQPPRENPWTDNVEREPSASPFHDWNERIHSECYRPNAYARIYDSAGRVERIVNNYAQINFNFGPTLLHWLERHHPDTYARIIEADRESVARRSGHGNAIAQGFHHAILPLCNERDRRTQVRWGIADFRLRFGREPESLWLPETACDDATLSTLIDEGLKYVILSPFQAGRVRVGGGEWRSVGDVGIDTSVPYKFLHPDNSGRALAVFFYEGHISKEIAFDGLLSSSRQMIDRFERAAGKKDSIVSVATDGESYGHHYRFGELCLAYALEVEAVARGFQVTNYGEFLESHPPEFEVEIKRGFDGGGTAWSCAHGLGRWSRDCGCQAGAPEGWNQRWRTPLRAALDYLRDDAALKFESAGGELLRDPWAARDAYVELLVDREASPGEFLSRHAARTLSEPEQARALTLLEIQRCAMAMYTSCGWFFNDISGIESVLVLKYAGRAVELMESLGLEPPRTKFLEVLAEAHSNIRRLGNGADIYLFPYRLRVTYPDGNSFTQRDAYAFLPTLGNFDEHFFNEGRHERVYDRLGAHVGEVGGVRGVSFAVWAPGADGVSVVGSFNNWDGRLHTMRLLGTSGIWELFVPDLEPGALYKYEIRRRGSPPFLKTDPYALYTEVPPATSSIVYESQYKFTDDDWINARDRQDHLRAPLSIYEVHPGSWRRILEEGNRSLTYRETAPALAAYCLEMGFTHVEFLPLKGHPYGGSWGYQVANYYAPTARFGTPDDFRYLIDYLHGQGVGVIMDWVPAHFPKDTWALGRFDGSALYEHLDPRLGEHPDWGTYIFNYGRNEVRNFLVANALFWINECHVDGLRVDAVASMLYLDYSRKEGDWLPNKYGGRENLEALDFIRELNTVVHRHHPGALMIAEESTAWPSVSRAVEDGGLGFDFKWNMGWMHDTLEYFKQDTLYRGQSHHNLTFGLVYAWSENFILPFSHDEVVHMKGSLLNKMFGDREKKFANLRALYGYMWAHPGKKLLFMGGELGQWREWGDDRSLDWHLLDEADHKGVQTLVRDLNRIYREEPALYEADIEPAGFEWIDADDATENVLAFMRVAPSTGAIRWKRRDGRGVHRGRDAAVAQPSLLRTR
ncbi:MAG: 1,4-alpha-glucan branching protein GlgB [Acidobacteria bacterium]|nr:1,4-alpha-glucan branching protein GlgB [Acidobacteriota bacterium]